MRAQATTTNLDRNRSRPGTDSFFPLKCWVSEKSFQRVSPVIRKNMPVRLLRDLNGYTKTGLAAFEVFLQNSATGDEIVRAVSPFIRLRRRLWNLTLVLLFKFLNSMGR